MKLPVLNNPYNQRKISKKDLKAQIIKRVKKHLGSTKSEIKLLKSNSKLDDFALEIIATKRANSGTEEIALPLSANYQAYILYYYFLFGETINKNVIFVFETISNRELEMLDLLYEDEMDNLFKEQFQMDEYKFKLVKKFVNELENKYPGSDLASSKSYSIIQEFISHHK